MANNRQVDSREFHSLTLPYVPNLGQLAGRPVLTDGQDVYSPWAGTLNKRPGTLSVTNSNIAQRAERLWIYETLEATPVVFLVGSFLNGSNKYELRYFNLSAGDTTWHLVTERKGCNHSLAPHEGIVRRGKLYIKGNPNSTDDSTKLGAVYLDGTGGSMATHDWGALGPTNPAALTSPAGWTASAHPVTVNMFWIYTYTIVKASGHETNRAPLETNPDNSPSATAAFTNKLPKMTVTGPSDTTEYPFLNIYRTTDGGGTFYFLKQIANTGGSITFEDKYLASGSGNADPIPDSQLDTAHVAPTQNSNSPPPTVAPPLVTGTDTIQRCTRLVEYSGRIWYGINEYLFYSALEELEEGIPEEAFPSGIALPNFFRMPEGITQLLRSPDGLVICTRRETLRIKGTTKSTFNPLPFLGGIGAVGNFQNRAGIEAGDNIAWVTQDYRLVVVHGDQYNVISNPLGTHFQTNNYTFDLHYWSNNDKEYLILGMINYSDPTLTHLHAYDVGRSRLVQDDYWFPPWSIKFSASVVGQSSISDTENKIFFGLWDGTNMRMGHLDATGATGSDINPTTGAASAFNYFWQTSLMNVPAGDHANEDRVPDLSPVAYKIEYTMTNGATAPTIQVYFDDIFTTPTTLGASVRPPRRSQSKGFTTLQNLDIKTVCKYIAFKFTGPTDTNTATYHTFSLDWLPDQGA